MKPQSKDKNMLWMALALFLAVGSASAEEVSIDWKFDTSARPAQSVETTQSVAEGIFDLRWWAEAGMVTASAGCGLVVPAEYENLI